MRKAKKQIRLTEGGLQDRFMVTVGKELGKTRVSPVATSQLLSKASSLGFPT